MNERVWGRNTRLSSPVGSAVDGREGRGGARDGVVFCWCFCVVVVRLKSLSEVYSMIVFIPNP